MFHSPTSTPIKPFIPRCEQRHDFEPSRTLLRLVSYDQRPGKTQDQAEAAVTGSTQVLIHHLYLFSCVSIIYFSVVSVHADEGYRGLVTYRA